MTKLALRRRRSGELTERPFTPLPPLPPPPVAGATTTVCMCVQDVQPNIPNLGLVLPESPDHAIAGRNPRRAYTDAVTYRNTARCVWGLLLVCVIIFVCGCMFLYLYVT